MPSVPERPNLFRLSCNVFSLAIGDISLACAHLPVGTEFNAVRWVKVDGLNLPLEPLLLCKTRHYQKRISENHPVRPMRLPVVLVRIKVNFLIEVAVQAVEVAEKIELLLV